MKNQFYSALSLIIFAALAGSSIDENDISTFKWIIIIAVVIGIAIPILQYVSRQQKAKTLRDIPNFNCDELITSTDGSNGIAIDKTQKKIAISDKASPLIINYSDLINVELLENGSTIMKKSTSRTVGGAIVGGVLLGPFGAVIGGVTGKSKVVDKTNSIALKIIINKLDNPVHYLYFLNSETKKDTFVYQNARKNAELWHGKFSSIINSIDNSETKQISSSSNSMADELKKLDDLRQKGILTEEEFIAQKKNY